MKRRKGHFEIHRVRTDGHDHFMCADYEWTVIDTRTGETVARYDEVFHGSMSGVEDIEFSKNGREIVVKYYDGKTTRRKLPNP